MMNADRSSRIPPLPVAALRADFSRGLRRGHLVIAAPTGSGKSTMVPAWCLEELGPDARVLVVEPRRVACRALSRFVSEGFGEEPGGIVGYRVQHEDISGPRTRILFATPGTALRLLQDGGCRHWPAVILDEFHERGLETDLLLAICRHEGIHSILVMSATLEKRRLSTFLDATLLEADGRLFPVDISYETENELPSPAGLEDRTARAVASIAAGTGGDLLVFLPGKAEISACAARLAGLDDTEVLPLHGGLPPAEQDRVFRPGDRPRVILTTNVAETSVTIPGIAAVIDSGLARQTWYRDGRTVLGLRAISRASAEQRRGRAGRLGPGRCLRLWGRQAVLQPDTPPEILRQDLSQAVLTAAAAGYELDRLPLLDAPRDFAVERAVASLTAVGAIEHGRITGLGRAMFRLPLDASLSRVLLEAKHEGYPGHLLQALVDLTAVLNLDRRLFLPPPGGSRGQDVSEERRSLAESGCDAAVLVRALRSGRVRQLELNPAVFGEARKVAGQVRSLLGLDPPGRAEGERVDSRGMALAWLRAIPGSAFVPRTRRDAWANDSGVELVLSRDSALKTGTPALVAAARRTVVGRGGRKTTFATCALPADFKLLVEAGLGEIATGRVRLDRGRVLATIERRYAGAVLERWEEEPRGAGARQAAARLILENRLLKGAGAEVAEGIERHNLRCRLDPQAGGVIKDTEGWLAARLHDLGLEQVSELEMISAADLLPPGPGAEEQAEFDRRFPRRLNLGNLQVRVEYDPVERMITLVREAGLTRQPPDPRYLPPWPGWRIRFRDRQRVLPVRR